MTSIPPPPPFFASVPEASTVALRAMADKTKGRPSKISAKMTVKSLHRGQGEIFDRHAAAAGFELEVEDIFAFFEFEFDGFCWLPCT